jgi:hypothetical protein
MMEVSSKNEKEIVFTDEDIKDFPPASWDDLPESMYSLFEIIKANPQEILIKLNLWGGSCGANLLARFCHTNEKIEQLVKEIAAKEQELMPDVLLAEIGHLPESRVGNILSRPHIREYEILYLSNSDLPEERKIAVSDLILSFRQGRLKLRSKRLNKEIIPRLTNGFLFAMQTRNLI